MGKRKMRRIRKENPVSIQTREALLKDKTKVMNKNTCKKYHKKIIAVNDHYNMLEYYLIVRMFMQKKYKIDNRLLELLFFLYPKKLFSWSDFKEYPLTFTYKRIDKIIELGMVDVVRPDTAKSRQIYRLSRKAQTIVVDFYAYLSGEKKMPTTRQNNPLLAKKPKTNRERMIQEMIQKMASSDTPRWEIE